VHNLICRNLVIAATLTMPGAALAQDKLSSPLRPFSLEKLQSAYASNPDMRPVRQVSHRDFFRRPGGALSAGARSFVYCKKAPPLFDEVRDGMKRVSHTYASTPQSGRFTCAGDEGIVSQVEYKTSAKVAGDVYTFSGQFAESYETKRQRFVKTMNEEAVVRFAGDTCTIVSYRLRTDDKTIRVEKTSNSWQEVTADANSTCQLRPD
jgi:hypothetical protein